MPTGGLDDLVSAGCEFFGTRTVREQVHKQFLSSKKKISYQIFSFQGANIFAHLVSQVHRLIAQRRVCLGFSSSLTLSTLSDIQTVDTHIHMPTHTHQRAAPRWHVPRQRYNIRTRQSDRNWVIRSVAFPLLQLEDQQQLQQLSMCNSATRSGFW